MEEKIIDFIQNELVSGGIEISSGEDLLGSGLIESMAMMRLIEYVEVEFSIQVQPQDMTIDNFISVDAITSFISRSK